MADFLWPVMPAIEATGEDPSGHPQVTVKDVAFYLSQVIDAISQAASSFVAGLAAQQIDYSQIGDLPGFQSVMLLAGFDTATGRPIRPTVDLDISGLQTQLTQLAVPQAPSLSFSYVDSGYNSGLRDPMIAKLLYDLLYGGYGIDTTDEVALWNRERDREALLAQSNIDEVKRQAASTSFPMPQGSLYAAIQKARQEFMAKVSSVNRDIGLKRAELYVLNRQATLDKVLRSEEQSIQLYNAVQNRALEAAKVTVQMALALFEAGIRVFEAQLKSVLSQIEAKVTSEKMKVELYAADTAAYTALVHALATNAQIIVEDNKLLFERDKTRYLAKVDIVKMRLEQLKTTVENMKDISKFGAEFFRTALGVALGGAQGQAVQTIAVS